eukprot:m.113767 g.113767  ORF g.113767 m.113767 type:complete len:308 (-) comp51875_c0_seq2:67-990(-)
MLKLSWLFPCLESSISRAICCQECKHTGNNTVFRIVAFPHGENSFAVYLQLMNPEEVLGDSPGALLISYEIEMRCEGELIQHREGTSQLTVQHASTLNDKACGSFVVRLGLEDFSLSAPAYALPSTSSGVAAQEYRKLAMCTELAEAEPTDAPRQFEVKVSIKFPEAPREEELVGTESPEEGSPVSEDDQGTSSELSDREGAPATPVPLTKKLKQGDCVVVRASRGFWVARIAAEILPQADTATVQWFQKKRNGLYVNATHLDVDNVLFSCIHPVPVEMLPQPHGLFALVIDPAQRLLISSSYGHPA